MHRLTSAAALISLMSRDTPKPSSVAFPASAMRATVWSICSHVDPDDEDGASNTTPAASLMHVLELAMTASDSSAVVATDATWLQPEMQSQPNRASTPEQTLDDQGGDGGCDGSGGGSCGRGASGGGGGDCGPRVPQSAQSVPKAHSPQSEPGPPSSQ